MNISLKTPTVRTETVLSQQGHAGIAYAPFSAIWAERHGAAQNLNHTNSLWVCTEPIRLWALTPPLAHWDTAFQSPWAWFCGKVLGKTYKTYCILGDGECDEGSNCEAAMTAAHKGKQPYYIR